MSEASGRRFRVEHPWKDALIGEGAWGKVYGVGEGLVGKIFHSCYSDEYLAALGMGSRNVASRREFEIANILYNNGISVPKPEGVFPVDFYNGSEEPKTHTGFVMEHVKGCPVEDIRDIDKQIRIEDLARKEICRAGEFAVVGFDCLAPGNVLYTPDRENEIVLVDFGLWRLLGGGE